MIAAEADLKEATIQLVESTRNLAVPQDIAIAKPALTRDTTLIIRKSHAGEEATPLATVIVTGLTPKSRAVTSV